MPATFLLCYFFDSHSNHGLWDFVGNNSRLRAYELDYRTELILKVTLNLFILAQFIFLALKFDIYILNLCHYL